MTHVNRSARLVRGMITVPLGRLRSGAARGRHDRVYTTTANGSGHQIRERLDDDLRRGRGPEAEGYRLTATNLKMCSAGKSGLGNISQQDATH